MIQAILLIASLANAQSTATVSASLEDQIKVSNLGKAVRDLESGRYKQTGKPTFLGGICFADGTCQTTGSGSSGASLTSTQTFSGANTFTSSLTVTASLVRGIAGGVVGSSVGITGATSTTISSLDGNSYGRIRVVIEGQMAAGSDGGITLMRPNNDSTNYRSEGVFGYGGGTGGVASNTTGMHLWRAYGTGAQTVSINTYFRCGTLASLARPFSTRGGGQQSGVGGFTGTFGGAWTDTSTNMTSLVFVWHAAFTGNVYVYQD